MNFSIVYWFSTVYMLEILLEIVINIWNDYILEYNLPFRRIDVTDLKGTTPAENTDARNSHDLHGSDCSEEGNAQEANLGRVEAFLNYFRVHSSPAHQDLFRSISEENNATEFLDADNEIFEKQLQSKDYKGDSDLDLIEFSSSDDSVSTIKDSSENQNGLESGKQDLEDRTQNSGDHKNLKEVKADLNKASGERSETGKHDELSERLPKKKCCAEYEMEGDLSSKKSSDDKSSKAETYQPFKSIFSIKDTIWPSDKNCSSKVQKDAVFDSLSDDVKKNVKGNRNNFKSIKENFLSADTKVDLVESVAQEKNIKNKPRMKLKMDLNELAELFRIPEISASAKSSCKAKSTLDRTISHTNLRSRSNERGDSLIRNKRAHSMNKVLEHSKMAKVNMKQSKKQQTLIWNRNSVFQTGKQLFNHSLQEVKRSYAEKCSSVKTDPTDKLREKMGSRKYLFQKKANAHRKEQQLEGFADASHKLPKHRQFFHGILNDAPNEKNSNEESSNDFNFPTSPCDSENVLSKFDEIPNNIDPEDSGDTESPAKTFNSHRTVMFGNCPNCAKEQPSKENPGTNNSRKLLTKDIPLQAYYKERRLKSKPKSAEITKRKNLSLSRKLDNIASKRVAFTEDNRIFSYDPNESIFESFYSNITLNGPQNDYETENTGKSVIFRSGVELVREEATVKNVTDIELTPEEKYTQEHENASGKTKVGMIRTETIKGAEKDKSSTAYTNLGFVDVPSFDCFPDFEQASSTLPTSITFDEDERLLSEGKISSASQIFNRFADMSDGNMKRWFRSNLPHKKDPLKRIKSVLFQGYSGTKLK